MLDCDRCTKIIDAWLASQGEQGMSLADREMLHSPEFRKHVNGCDACSAYLGEAAATMAETAGLAEDSKRAAEDKVLRAHLLQLFESRGLLDDDGRLRVVDETSAFPSADQERGRRSFDALADVVRRVAGEAALLVGAFGLRLPPVAPATRGNREGVAMTPPYQLALWMPALAAWNWQPDVTLEARPSEIRLLFTAQPGANRAELAIPHAAIRTKEGSLVVAGDLAELRWLEDGSDRCFLTVWKPQSAEERLQELIDPAADDALVVWIN